MSRHLGGKGGKGRIPKTESDESPMGRLSRMTMRLREPTSYERQLEKIRRQQEVSA